MRSLWRILALQWLGGDGSEALTADSAILEGLPYPADARCLDNRADRVHLELSGNALLRHQDGVSPWRVISVRQSEAPAPLRRDAGVIEPARTKLRR
jgi:hypothetical protein